MKEKAGHNDSSYRGRETDPLNTPTSPDASDTPAAEGDLKGVAEMRRLLAERFPACFQPHKSKLPKRPIKIGIHRDIAAVMPELSARAIGRALAEYTRGPRYLREAVRGAVRIDLDGMPAGEVTEAEARDFQGYLQRTLQRIDAHRAAKQAYPSTPEPSAKVAQVLRPVAKAPPAKPMLPAVRVTPSSPSALEPKANGLDVSVLPSVAWGQPVPQDGETPPRMQMNLGSARRERNLRPVVVEVRTKRRIVTTSKEVPQRGR